MNHIWAKGTGSIRFFTAVVILGSCALSSTACVSTPGDGDTVNDAPSFGFFTPYTGWYGVGQYNYVTQQYDLPVGVTAVNATGTPAWTDCAAMGNMPWYYGSIAASDATSAQGQLGYTMYPWEYFRPGAYPIGTTNMWQVQVSGVTTHGTFDLVTFADYPHGGSQTLFQCVSQYQCSSDMINNCRSGSDHLTLYSACGAAGQHCCAGQGGLYDACNSGLSCDWDFTCRANLWPSTLSSTDLGFNSTDEDWNYNIQGLASDGSYWYVTQGNKSNTQARMYKVNMSWDFASTCHGCYPSTQHVGDPLNMPTGTVATAQAATLPSTEFCWHWGDVDTYKGQVYVPEENCYPTSADSDGPNRLAIFNASDLSFVGSVPMDSSHLTAMCGPAGFGGGGPYDCSVNTRMPAVAVHPITGEIYIVGQYSSSTGSCEYLSDTYNMFVMRPTSKTGSAPFSAGFDLALNRVLQIINADGSRHWIGGCDNGFGGVQGIAFSPTGEKLYVVDQTGGSIHAFQVTPRYLMFEKDYASSANFSDNMESEGITVLDMTGKTYDFGAGVSKGNSQIHVEFYHDPSLSGSEHRMYVHHLNITGGPF